MLKTKRRRRVARMSDDSDSATQSDKVVDADLYDDGESGDDEATERKKSKKSKKVRSYTTFG